MKSFPDRSHLRGLLKPVCVTIATAFMALTGLAQWQFTRLKSFGNPELSAVSPVAAVIQGRDGALYGTTPGFGAGLGGTVFRLSENGTGFRSLHDFPSFPGDGVSPIAG